MALLLLLWQSAPSVPGVEKAGKEKAERLGGCDSAEAEVFAARAFPAALGLLLGAGEGSQGSLASAPLVLTDSPAPPLWGAGGASSSCSCPWLNGDS